MKSKAEIFADNWRVFESVYIPEWGGDVTVRTMTALERDSMEQDWKKQGRPDGDYSGFSAWVVAHTVTNGNGELFFNPQEDFVSLCQQPANHIMRLFNAACRLNALTKADQEALVKN